MIVRALPGWPVSASALLDGLNAQLGREQLLHIVGSDPFGAHAHFPVLVRIRESGQVPPRLQFDPGEALRLTRHGDGPDVNHLARAWSCTLLAISGFDDVTDDLTNIAAQLIESCLALGGNLPQLAEQLMAWRAVTEEPDTAGQHGDDHGYADPVALLAMLLLRAATDPADARLTFLARKIAYACTAEPHTYRWPAGRLWPGGRRWRRLVAAILDPLRHTNTDVERLITVLH